MCRDIALYSDDHDDMLHVYIYNFLSVLITSNILSLQGVSDQSANTRRLPNGGLMLTQRRRRLANIRPTFGQRLVSSVSFISSHGYTGNTRR